MSEAKRFAEGFSDDKDWRKAAAAAARTARTRLGAGPCDLALVFVSEAFEGFDPAEFSTLLAKGLAPLRVLGCNASGVIAGRKEIERTPGISILAMRLPGVRVQPFTFAPAELGRLEDGAALVKELDLYPNESPKFMILGDPASADPERMAALFNEAYPGAPLIGGMASGLLLHKPSWMLLGSSVLTQGLAGVALVGPVEIQTVVAQGCRPIGDPLIVTRAEGNVLHELGGRNPLEVLRETLSKCTPDDQRLARSSLFAGLVMNEGRSEFRRGDFVIRNLLGYDDKSGSLVLGANLRRGQTLQFQLRDAHTSDQDFSMLLGSLPEVDAAPRGALLFSCCGRGKGLYGESDHDATLVQTLRGPVPMAGFFANGEFGPVGGRNFVHGYTSSLALIK
ncbi:MAG: FIST C-terminal domain-containing protein [Elusimicrobia bacterium]|nr:FIST C-terminal domain-containing protein [Elusimicrobiota bacterium]